MRKCDACGSDEIATVSTKYEGNYTECTKCGKRTYIPSYDELVYKVDALQARIDELEHKNEVLMDSYLESETIDDKGKLVGSLEYFKKHITDLESENKALRLIAGSHSMSELRRNRIMAGIEQFIEKYREGSDA